MSAMQERRPRVVGVVYQAAQCPVATACPRTRRLDRRPVRMTAVRSRGHGLRAPRPRPPLPTLGIAYGERLEMPLSFQTNMLVDAMQIKKAPLPADCFFAALVHHATALTCGRMRQSEAYPQPVLALVDGPPYGVSAKPGPRVLSSALPSSGQLIWHGMAHQFVISLLRSFLRNSRNAEEKGTEDWAHHCCSYTLAPSMLALPT
jgi:hypothetical protein